MVLAGWFLFSFAKYVTGLLHTILNLVYAQPKDKNIFQRLYLFLLTWTQLDNVHISQRANSLHRSQVLWDNLQLVRKQISKKATHTAILWSSTWIYSEPESVFRLHGSHAAPLLNLWVLLLHKHDSSYEEPPLIEMHWNFEIWQSSCFINKT